MIKPLLKLYYLYCKYSIVFSNFMIVKYTEYRYTLQFIYKTTVVYCYFSLLSI